MATIHATIDRPLTRSELGELRSRSTRANITSTSFTNDYAWGSFRGDEDAWMEKYFDAFLYVDLRSGAYLCARETYFCGSGAYMPSGLSEEKPTTAIANQDAVQPTGPKRSIKGAKFRDSEARPAWEEGRS